MPTKPPAKINNFSLVARLCQIWLSTSVGLAHVSGQNLENKIKAPNLNGALR